MVVAIRRLLNNSWCHLPKKGRPLKYGTKEKQQCSLKMKTIHLSSKRKSLPTRSAQVCSQIFSTGSHEPEIPISCRRGTTKIRARSRESLINCSWISWESLNSYREYSYLPFYLLMKNMGCSLYLKWKTFRSLKKTRHQSWRALRRMRWLPTAIPLMLHLMNCSQAASTGRVQSL